LGKYVSEKALKICFNALLVIFPRAHFMIGGRQFSTHFNGFFVKTGAPLEVRLTRNVFAGGFGYKTIVLKGLQNNRRLARRSSKRVIVKVFIDY